MSFWARREGIKWTATKMSSLYTPTASRKTKRKIVHNSLGWREPQDIVYCPSNQGLMSLFMSLDIFQRYLIIWEMHMIPVIWRERIQNCIYSMIPVLYDTCIEKCWLDINEM